MTALRTSDQANNPTPALAGVLFTRTHDGLLVAKVRDNAFAMMPTKNDRYYLASAWRLLRPMEEWSRGDFYGHGGELADEAAFRASVHENAEHQRQRAALGRREIRTGANTPWGASQYATVYARRSRLPLNRRTRRLSSRCCAQCKGPPCPSRAWRLVRRGLRVGGCRASASGIVHRLRTALRRSNHPRLVSRRVGDDSRTSASAGRISREGSPGLRARSCFRLDRDFGDPLRSPSWHDGMRRHARRRSPRCRAAPLSRAVRRISRRPIRLRDQ